MAGNLLSLLYLISVKEHKGICSLSYNEVHRCLDASLRSMRSKDLLKTVIVKPLRINSQLVNPDQRV